jgi:hypothetical protein
MLDTRSSNRSLGEQVHDALVRAAEKKAEALRLRKTAERRLDLAFRAAKGSVEVRKAAARTSEDYTACDLDALEAECAAVVAKAEADGLGVQFEEYRTRAATARAEMTLR